MRSLGGSDYTSYYMFAVAHHFQFEHECLYRRVESNLMKMKEKLTDSSPVSVFEEVFSEEIVELILKESVRYATECKNRRPSTTISSDDLKNYSLECY